MATQSVDLLRKTWRSTEEHLVEQVERFVRLTAIAAAPAVIDLLKGGKFDYVTLLAFIVPFAEVAWRQMHPAMTASRADTAPGVTIVPEQVGMDAPEKAPDGVPAVDTQGFEPDPQWTN